MQSHTEKPVVSLAAIKVVHERSYLSIVRQLGRRANSQVAGRHRLSQHFLCKLTDLLKSSGFSKGYNA